MLFRAECVPTISQALMAAYYVQFAEESYKQGARQFPLLVPTSAEDPAVPANRKAWEVLSKWRKPFLTAFSDSDPITKGGEKILQATIPGAKNQRHPTIAARRHFLQQDKGE